MENKIWEREAEVQKSWTPFMAIFVLYGHYELLNISKILLCVTLKKQYMVLEQHKNEEIIITILVKHFQFATELIKW